MFGLASLNAAIVVLHRFAIVPRVSPHWTM
jgi:hypothetical protein